jgi:hypothetical protein
MPHLIETPAETVGMATTEMEAETKKVATTTQQATQATQAWETIYQGTETTLLRVN